MADNPKDDDQILPSVDEDSVSVPTPNPSTTDSVKPIQSEPTMNNTEAEDVDIIEKGWIDRAKHIVDQTSNDPYEQQKMISKMKAEYIKKRFNKDIKISEE